MIFFATDSVILDDLKVREFQGELQRKIYVPSPCPLPASREGELKGVGIGIRNSRFGISYLYLKLRTCGER
jgi:hypothetical protein